ncbi:SagB/ThcOx family dehydrogenase [Solidesulfovibrio sp.]|uniref:SagB/ThcOx family dehydrogenase n=1 Tax=Solidesulfovibrio sp. TaxID=2910990 RepID=UPI00262C9A32|nr:SagB/ThcOx family dehydrogenase [Solidesulfovibrio sp.]
MRFDLKFFLKDTVRKMVDFSTTAQNRGLPAPPLQKPYPPGAALVPLPGPGDGWPGVAPVSLAEAVANRRSRRVFDDAPLTLAELGFLLWASQGLRKAPGASGFRTVPSAGCRHALETYLAVFRVAGLAKGLYRYLPVEHALLLKDQPDDLEAQVSRAAFDQRFTARGAATFFWTTVPERMEWRYAEASYKVIALDAGHVCQNLYLACEAVGAGTCAVAAYDQEACDALLGVDGEAEFTVYLAPVGRVAAGKGGEP